MDTKTLKELFESCKDQLALQLEGLSLPKDSQKVQLIVTSYLNTLFDSNGEFRQGLTQSEDYIVQAAMSLLNAQQSIVGEFVNSNVISDHNNDKSKSDIKEPATHQTTLKKEYYPYVVGGTAVGGAAGALLLSSWGAVFGAIAGTALVLYYSTTLQSSSKSTPVQNAKPVISAQKINVVSFLNIVGNICDSIDSLILTFRSQINRVVSKYENQEKPLLEKEYGVLLDSIQSLLGANYQLSDEKWQKRIQSRIEQLAESLENYDLDVVIYDENNKNFFEEVISEKVEQTTMVLPAIVKQGKEIRKGKVFVKAL